MDGTFEKPYYNSSLANTLANFPNLALLFECNEVTDTSYMADSVSTLKITETTGGQKTVTRNSDGTLTLGGSAAWNEILSGTLPSPGTKNIFAFWLGKSASGMTSSLNLGNQSSTGGIRVATPDGGVNGISGAVDDTGASVTTGLVAAVDGNSTKLCAGYTTVQWGSATGLNGAVYDGTTFEALTAGNIAAKTTIAAIAQAISVPFDLRPFMFGAFYTTNTLPSQLWFKAALMWMQARGAEATPRKLLFPGLADL